MEGDGKKDREGFSDAKHGRFAHTYVSGIAGLFFSVFTAVI